LDGNNVSIVHSNGKGPMDRLLRIFNGFKIPTFTWFDGDKSNADTEIKRKTVELLELLGKPAKIEDVKTVVDDNFAVLEENLEKTLRAELPDYDAFVSEAQAMLGPIGKPLKSRYVALKVAEKVKAGQDAKALVPRTINSIVEKLKVLHYRGSMLKGK
jgi:putative ATP-dependent endonuclease of OLD family